MCIGHHDLITTQRYMHLNPAAIESAIRLLDRQGPAGHYVRSETGRAESGRGEILETADLESTISNPYCDLVGGEYGTSRNWVRDIA